MLAKKWTLPLLALIIMGAMTYRFYTKSAHFIDVDSHIPATIVAKQQGYNLSGYGLSFVCAEGVEGCYGQGGFTILERHITPSSFSHYTSTIGFQGFLYAWLYENLGLQSLKPLYVICALFAAVCLLAVAVLLGRIFGRFFGVVFLGSLFIYGWVARFGGSLYFSFGILF